MKSKATKSKAMGPVTAQDWIDTADDVVSKARDAAASGDKARMRLARQACSDFISSRTLACPQEVVDAVAGVQVQLSQLIVAEDVGSIAKRTVQIDAFLQDIERISTRAKQAADLISFKSAKDIVDNITGVVGDLKTLKQIVKTDPTELTPERIQEIMDRLSQIVNDFEGLASAS